MPRLCWLRLAVLVATLLAPVVIAGQDLPGRPGLPASADASANDNPYPTIYSLTPDSVIAGGTAFSLTVHGAGYVRGAVVYWNGAGQGTAFVSDSQVRATITSTDVATAGTASITVRNPPPDGGSSNTVLFTIRNPIPWVHSLSPDLALKGGGAFTLGIRGGGFVPESVVRWEGQDRPTTYVSRNQLQAAIGTADMAAPGSISVTVFNPAPGGGTSNAAIFQVNHPRPSIQGIDPLSATAGGESFALTVYGVDLAPESLVRWDGEDRTTTFVSGTQLLATILAADIAAPGSATVTVFTPAPGGGVSNAVAFSVEYPRPTILRLEPPWAREGGVAFTLTAYGRDFYRGAVVHWNGSARGTAFINSTQVRATITLLDIASAGIAYITVVNPAPGGGTSNALPFRVRGQETYAFLPAVAKGHPQ